VRVNGKAVETVRGGPGSRGRLPAALRVVERLNEQRAVGEIERGRGDVDWTGGGDQAANGRDTELDDERLSDHVGRHRRGGLRNGLNARHGNDRTRWVMRKRVGTAMFGRDAPRVRSPTTPIVLTRRMRVGNSQGSFRMIRAGPRATATIANARGHKHQQSENSG
jgi:hypothetical protein